MVDDCIVNDDDYSGDNDYNDDDYDDVNDYNDDDGDDVEDKESGMILHNPVHRAVNHPACDYSSAPPVKSGRALHLHCGLSLMVMMMVGVDKAAQPPHLHCRSALVVSPSIDDDECECPN